jgi:hypothetical protein
MFLGQTILEIERVIGYVCSGVDMDNRGSQKNKIEFIYKNHSFIERPSAPIIGRVELTRGNHFEFGYNNVPFSIRSSPAESFRVAFGRPCRPVLDWRTEVMFAAREVAERGGKDLWLCVAGRSEDQVVSEALRAVQAQFQVAILRLNNDINVDDVSWAVISCEQRGIPYRIFDVDLNVMFRSGELKEMALASHAHRISDVLNSKLASLVAGLGGFFVNPSGQLQVKRRKGGMGLQESERSYAVFRHFMINQIAGVPGFFRWNPELMASFIAEDSAPSHAFYSRHFKVMPERKFNGVARLRASVSKIHSRIRSQLADSDQNIWIATDELLWQLELNGPSMKPAEGTRKSEEAFGA